MEITNLQGYVELSNKVKMPYFGLGVFLMKDGQEVIDAVMHALEAGYIHIDTAALYNNEIGVGEAIRNSSIHRKDIFVTSKVWNSDQGYDSTLKAFDKSLEKLGFDYLDLYLVHWPVKGKYKSTWKAIEELYKQGRVKSIGVSNFLQHHLEDLIDSAEIIPMVNQVEFHPYLVQQDLINFCVKYKIQFEAWSPLMQGKMLSDKLINKLALKYEKTAAQIILRWNLQKGVVTIPKSSKQERIISNSQIFDFKIS
ncbi:MAG: aldo/keto reductase, partial [Ignavibacteriae bacterium]|nr:aldo/keto reductase [Ignavibacteriota bacterium]